VKKSIGAIVSAQDQETWKVLHRLRNGQPRAKHPRKAAPKPRPAPGPLALSPVRPKYRAQGQRAPWSGYAQVDADYRQQLIDKGFLRPAQKPTNA